MTFLRKYALLMIIIYCYFINRGFWASLGHFIIMLGGVISDNKAIFDDKVIPGDKAIFDSTSSEAIEYFP